MKNSEQSAFPFTWVNETAGHTEVESGLTKREYFAAKAMEALLSNPEITNHVNGFPEPEAVIKYADRLLTQLSKQQ